MKINFLLLISALIFSFNFVSCIEKSAVEDSTAKNAAATAGAVADYTFDAKQHEIDNEMMNTMIYDFDKHFARSYGGQNNRIIMTQQKVDVADFKRMFPNENGKQEGLRIHLGLNNGGEMVYYISIVKFDDNVNLVNNTTDEYALDFLPEDNYDVNGNLDYLRNTKAFKLSSSGKLTELIQTRDYQEMIAHWQNYKQNVKIKSITRDNNLETYRAISSNDARTAVFPLQIIYKLISDNNASIIYIQSGAALDSSNNTYKHSIVISHPNVSVKVNTLPKSNQEIQSFKEALVRLGYMIPETNKKHKLELIKDKIGAEPIETTIKALESNLSTTDLMLLNLSLAPQNAFFGAAADYSQLCPTRCGRLLGTYNASTNLFKIKGFEK